MANTLAPALITTLIGTIQEVARTTGGVTNAMTFLTSEQTAGLGQTIELPEMPEISAINVTPAMAIPEPADVVVTDKTMTLDQHKAGTFGLTGEEIRALGVNAAGFRSEAITAAVASVITAMSAHMVSKLDQGSGYALGSVGTNPFASNYDTFIDAGVSLDESLCRSESRFALVRPDHKGSLVKLMQKANEAPSGSSFAMGQVGELNAFATFMDQSVTTHAVGTGTLYVTNGVQAAGATSIVIKTGTGTVLAGDVVTFAGDTANKYVVKVGVAAPGTIVLNSPLKVAIAGDAAMTIAAAHKIGFAGHRSAGVIGMRPSAEIPGGDAATFAAVVRDPVTGIALRFAEYKGWHKVRYEVSAVYGSVIRRPAWLRKIIA